MRVHNKVDGPPFYMYKFTADNKPAKYDDLSLPEFVSGYVSIVENYLESKHLNR